MEITPTMINVPISLEQLAVGLQKLSRSNLLTLELLLDKKAMETIQASLRASAKGKVKPFKLSK